MNNISIICSFCRELHPEAKDDAEAVLIHQKELQRLIDFKTKYDIHNSEDIEMYFVLHEVRNHLKAKELLNKNPEEEII